MKRDTYIKTEHIRRLKNGTVKGYFLLSDGSKTSFDIDKHGEWNQWGNSTENLFVTVPRLEKLQSEVLYGD